MTFAAADARLRAAVTALAAQGESELADPQLHPARRRVLESLGAHWTGLTVFVEHPEVPMDNNTAERAQRGPVVGRKNYYGSGAVWAGRLVVIISAWDMVIKQGSVTPDKWVQDRMPMLHQYLIAARSRRPLSASMVSVLKGETSRRTPPGSGKRIVRPSASSSSRGKPDPRTSPSPSAG